LVPVQPQESQVAPAAPAQRPFVLWNPAYWAPRYRLTSNSRSSPASFPGLASPALPAASADSERRESAASAHRGSDAAGERSAAPAPEPAVPASCTPNPPPIRSYSPREIPHTFQPDYPEPNAIPTTRLPARHRCRHPHPATPDPAHTAWTYPYPPTLRAISSPSPDFSANSAPNLASNAVCALSPSPSPS
jgi:hypothetical protein